MRRAQPDLRAMVEVHLAGKVKAAELVAAGQALAKLASLEFVEIEFSGMAPPVQLDQMPLYLNRTFEVNIFV